jgi:hypothetical protein
MLVNRLLSMIAGNSVFMPFLQIDGAAAGFCTRSIDGKLMAAATALCSAIPNWFLFIVCSLKNKNF